MTAHTYLPPDTYADAPRADPERVRAAVATAARYGPYFGWHTGAATATLSREQLFDPDQLRVLLRTIGDNVGSEEDRVTASTFHYGFAARCWSMALGVWQRGGVVIDPSTVRYVVNPSGSVDLSLNEFRGWDGNDLAVDEAADLVAAVVMTDHLTRLHSALRAAVRVADGLLWGNVAAALSSAARRVGAGRSDDRVTPVATTLLARDPLRSKMVPTAAGGLRRNTCCLWYRTRDHTKCGDCPLA
ncbi:(2Fe-2S)-binding protein [[Mycobacterium] wendilense]|uniref:(2Fe-2S)-binding protein n=1 Tax=[Mycobacterium] wendilense TaxID=3064284 RepID=A0ABM9MKE5_9MYCO|nr:(2Fe-2S)-binding protein [Mycolicibacterium sp. MU0050]CAJ1587394.1 (2Fe-2S)-binding protein [Mycolicibacterium sp. MU0050]